MNEEGSFIIKGLTLEITAEKTDLSTIKGQTMFVDDYLRKRYWFYIKGAELIDPQAVKTNMRTYFLFTYFHENAFYLVISSLGKQDKIVVNTFVRLGKPS